MPSGQPRRQQQRQGWLAADFSRMLVRRKPRPDGDCALSRSEVDQLLTRKDISLRERTLWRWALGYRWAPRLADLPDLRLWRIDRHAHYGPLDGLARNHINTPLIAEHWDEICRLTASLRAGTVVSSAILRTLQRGPAFQPRPRPGRTRPGNQDPARARIRPRPGISPHDPSHAQPASAATRWPATSSTGQRGQLRKHYQVGQENQLDNLGIMVNVIVLWQTVYTQAALEHLAASGYPLDPADVARLTPLGHPTINLDGRYRTTSRPPTTGLRPLRTD